MSRSVGDRRVKTDDGFARFAVAQALAGQALDSFGIVAQAVEGNTQLFADFFLLLHAGIKAQNLLAHPLVLFDERQVPNRDGEEARDEQQEHHQTSQLIPNPEVDVHRSELSMTAGRSKRTIPRSTPGSGVKTHPATRPHCKLRRFTLKIAVLMTDIEQQILDTLNALQTAAKAAGAPGTKPDLQSLFARLDELAGRLSRDADRNLLHYLQRKSYENARLLLLGRGAENARGACG